MTDIIDANDLPDDEEDTEDLLDVDGESDFPDADSDPDALLDEATDG